MPNEKLLENMEVPGRFERREGSSLLKRIKKIGAVTAAAVSCCIASGKAIGQTMEEYLGNRDNYRQLSFMPRSVGWCSVVDNNALRCMEYEGAPFVTPPLRIVEKSFRVVYPPNIEQNGEERVIHEQVRTSDFTYGISFITDNENEFEISGVLSENTSVLFRNTTRFIETPRTGGLYYALNAPMWPNQICVTAQGPRMAGSWRDSADFFCFDENEPEERLPITDSDFYSRAIRRSDINYDPPDPNQLAFQIFLAATRDHAFTTERITEGSRDITNRDVFVFDRSPDGTAVNRRPLLATAQWDTVVCAAEDDDSLVLFSTDENERLKAGVFLKDADSDEVPNLADNCPSVPNPTDEFGRQANSDEDALGDACDRCPQDTVVPRGETDDPDNDNVCNRVGNESLGTTGDDNCPEVFNTDQLDTDSDRRGNVCDTCPGDRENDRDRDGVCAGNPVGTELANDNCPINRNPDQLDTDMDGAGDVCDQCPLDPLNDEDMDFFCADEDPCPRDFENRDPDSDGLCADEDPCPRDPTNPDIDLDGKCDSEDLCPTDPHDRDRDEDGICDVNDPCVEGFEQCQTEPDAGITDGGNKDASISDAAIPPTPDAHTTTPDAPDGRIQRDAETERTDTNTNIPEPPKDGCVDCNQTGTSPTNLIALFGLALSRVFRRKFNQSV